MPYQLLKLPEIFKLKNGSEIKKDYGLCYTSAPTFRNNLKRISNKLQNEKSDEFEVIGDIQDKYILYEYQISEDNTTKELEIYLANTREGFTVNKFDGLDWFELVFHPESMVEFNSPHGKTYGYRKRDNYSTRRKVKNVVEGNRVYLFEKVPFSPTSSFYRLNKDQKKRNVDLVMELYIKDKTKDIEAQIRKLEKEKENIISFTPKHLGNMVLYNKK